MSDFCLKHEYSTWNGDEPCAICEANADESSVPTRGHIDIVFDGPPGPVSGRFVEVEDATGKSIGVGEWVQDGDLWRLRVPDHRDLTALRARLATAEADVKLYRDRLGAVATEREQLEADVARVNGMRCCGCQRWEVRGAEAMGRCGKWLIQTPALHGCRAWEKRDEV